MNDDLGLNALRGDFEGVVGAHGVRARPDAAGGFGRAVDGRGRALGLAALEIALKEAPERGWASLLIVVLLGTVVISSNHFSG